MKNKKTGFTLIELIAVLVILAILALIVTPLVLNIIKKARVSADKRSIDAYGRSVELAIADYLLDTGDFPTSIEQLTIEYTGDRVVCATQGINEDTTIYLLDCTVGGRKVTGYGYGRYGAVSESEYEAYNVGDEVAYNGVNYYVLKNSKETDSLVTLLKAEAITSEEISPYIESTEVASKVNTTGTYMQMPYYSRDNCVSAGDISGCTTDYDVSDVKQVVDGWKIKDAREASEARLITYDEYTDLSEVQQVCTGICYEAIVPQYDWMYNSNYWYWTMSPYNDSASHVWNVNNDGTLRSNDVGYDNGVVRPVIVLSKSVL